jgi:hypothetical protein
VTLILPPTIPAIDPNAPRSRRFHEVFREAHSEGRKSVNARLWAYRAFDLLINVFDFTVSRHRDRPDEVLQNYTGPLMADCWSGFLKIELRSDSRIQRGACWSHARRKVFAGRSSHPQQASVLLAMIRELYASKTAPSGSRWNSVSRCGSPSRARCWTASGIIWRATPWPACSPKASSPKPWDTSAIIGTRCNCFSPMAGYRSTITMSNS